MNTWMIPMLHDSSLSTKVCTAKTMNSINIYELITSKDEASVNWGMNCVCHCRHTRKQNIHSKKNVDKFILLLDLFEYIGMCDIYSLCHSGFAGHRFLSKIKV